MQTYLVLGRYTSEGAGAISTLSTTEVAAQHFQNAGIELKSIYLTLGQHDLAALIEVPDEQTLVKFLGQVGTQGRLSTQTLRAFSVDEFAEVTSSAPAEA